MIRLYVCLTNSCNANCEFCCMWSSSNKKTYMVVNVKIKTDKNVKVKS